MITHLRGKLVEKNPTYLVVECNGVGYLVHISLNTYSLIGDEEAVFIYTYLQIREDAHTLYGFAEKSERETFKLLLSVSGIGASTARTMLSSMTPTQIRDAIASGDVPSIQAIKGIGSKTAQRVIVDLKDKVLKIPELGEVSLKTGNTTKEEALSALEVLGFARKQSEKVVEKVLSEEASLSVETVIKRALNNL